MLNLLNKFSNFTIIVWLIWFDSFFLVFLICQTFVENKSEMFLIWSVTYLLLLKDSEVWGYEFRFQLKKTTLTCLFGSKIHVLDPVISEVNVSQEILDICLIFDSPLIFQMLNSTSNLRIDSNNMNTFLGGYFKTISFLFMIQFAMSFS